MTFFYLVWIDKDDSTWSNVLLMMSFILVVCIKTTMARSSTRTIGTHKIRRLFCMVMMFPLLITIEVRDFLCLISIKDTLSNKGPPSNPEFSSTFSRVPAYINEMRCHLYSIL